MPEDVVERPDRRCLFVAEEETGVESEKVNEYDDMEVVVCEATRDVVVQTRDSTAKLCQPHAEHCVETGEWEFVGEELEQQTLATDGGTPSDGTCHCEGEFPDWNFHHETGCGDTELAFRFVAEAPPSVASDTPITEADRDV